jgi:hypothetical protein
VIGIATVAMVVAVVAAGGSPNSSYTGSSAYETPTTSYYDGLTPTTDFSDSSTDTSPSYASTAFQDGTAGTWTITGQDDQGYSAEVQLGVDTPIRASEAETSSVGRAVGACTITEETDAIIPVHIQETNTSSGFSEILGFSMAASTDYLGTTSDLRLASDVSFTSGPECIDPDDSTTGKVYGVQWTDPISASSSSTDTFYLVAYNYFSPLHPDGDAEALQQYTLSPTLTFGDTNSGDGRFVTDTNVTSPSQALFNIA